ncbi:MAG: replication initiation protein, partial [Schleiferiaceae bacterium]
MEELSLERGQQASLFFERLPFKPYCVDDFGDGLKIRGRGEAVKRRHVQYNTPAKVAYLCFDVDKDRAHEAWFDANLPAPSLVVQNPANGHAHILYAIKTPVCRTNAARLKPLRYLAAVEEGLRAKLGADEGFAGLMCKTPHHTAWRTFEA